MGISLGFGSQTLLVIDPGRHTLKMGVGTLGSKGRSAKLHSVYTVQTGATPQNSPDEVIERTGDLIQQVIKEHKIAAKLVSFAIPGRASFVRQLKVPRVSGDRLNRLVLYEARQQIPFPIEDIILDSHVFEGDGPELGVTLVAIRRNVIDQYCDMLKKAGLVPDVIDVTTLSLFDAFYPDTKADDEDVIAMVDIGASTTDIVVSRTQRVEFIRSAPQAGDQLTKTLAGNLGVEWTEAEEQKIALGELDPGIDRQTDPLSYGEDDMRARVRVFLSKAFDGIANEIRRTLDFYVSQPDGEPVGKIYLTGGTARCPGIADFIENRLGIPCEIKNPFEATLVNVDDLQKEPLETTAPVLLGQCQRGIADVPLRMNFLPPAIVRRKAFEKRRAILVAEGLLLAILIGFSVVTVKQGVRVNEGAKNALFDKLEGKGDVAEKIKTLTTKTQELEKRFTKLDEVGHNRGVISRTVSAIAENFPLGQAWMTRVDVDTQNITMTVSGERPEAVGAFKENMEEVGHLRDLTIQSQARQPDGTVSFVVEAQVEKKPSPEVRRLREKLENRGIRPFDLFFIDANPVTSAKESCQVLISVPEPLDEAERSNLVMDILQAAADADLQFDEENFDIYFHSYRREQVGNYKVLHPDPQALLKGEKQVGDLTLITPEGV